MLKTLALALVLTAAVAAAPTVSGQWKMSVSGGPHGNATMGLSLKQEGTSVTGTFITGHADLPVTGEFADGALKLESTSSGDSKIILSAKLKEDGTLSGYVSSPMGDMTWTATRHRSPQSATDPHATDPHATDPHRFPQMKPGAER
jgi:hypothetical protein